MRALFAQLHAELATLSAFPQADLKSRVVRHDTYFVGDGSPQNGTDVKCKRGGWTN